MSQEQEASHGQESEDKHCSLLRVLMTGKVET